MEDFAWECALLLLTWGTKNDQVKKGVKKIRFHLCSWVKVWKWNFTPRSLFFGVPPIFSEGQVVQASSSLFFLKRGNEFEHCFPALRALRNNVLGYGIKKHGQGPVIWSCKESPSMPSDAVKSKLWSFTLTAALFERAIKVQERYLDIVRSWLSTSSSIHRSSIIIIIIIIIIFFFFFFFIIVNRSSVGHHIIAICFPTLRFNRIETEFLCSLGIARIWSSAWEMAPISHSSED